MDSGLAAFAAPRNDREGRVGDGAPTMKDWVAYYDSDHSIYVNARHRDVHYARLADAIANHVPGSAAAVLDYGCGEALHADRVADAAGRLTLADAGPAVRSRLIERFKGNPKIMVISTERTATLLPRSFDMVILHSVSQYLTPEEFDRTARLFHRLLQPGGLLLVGDVVAPDASAVSDSLALLQFSIWYRRSWVTTLKSMIDGLLYALLTAGTFGWLWPR